MENELTIATILYHPTQDEISTLQSLSNWGGRFICFDNASGQNNLGLSPHTELLGDGKNVGVAKGLNAILEQAFRRTETRYVLFLDQDSILDLLTLQTVWVDLQPLFDHGAVVQFCGDQSSQPKIERKRLLINSGMVFRRDAWQEIGGMDERLFVDGVDYDYSLRLHVNGFSLYTVGVRGLFDHTSRQAGRSASLFGKRIWMRNYGTRYGEIYRSHLRLILASIARLETAYALTFAKALVILTTGHILSLFSKSRNTERGEN